MPCTGWQLSRQADRAVPAHASMLLCCCCCHASAHRGSIGRSLGMPDRGGCCLAQPASQGWHRVLLDAYSAQAALNAHDAICLSNMETPMEATDTVPKLRSRQRTAASMHASSLTRCPQLNSWQAGRQAPAYMFHQLPARSVHSTSPTSVRVHMACSQHGAHEEQHVAAIRCLGASMCAPVVYRPCS